MKCLKIKDGVIDNIILNEVCLLGCGLFLEIFVSFLFMIIEEFVYEGIYF